MAAQPAGISTRYEDAGLLALRYIAGRFSGAHMRDKDGEEQIQAISAYLVAGEF